jgi:hypothetical protein
VRFDSEGHGLEYHRLFPKYYREVVTQLPGIRRCMSVIVLEIIIIGGFDGCRLPSSITLSTFLICNTCFRGSSTAKTGDVTWNLILANDRPVPICHSGYQRYGRSRATISFMHTSEVNAGCYNDSVSLRPVLYAAGTSTPRRSPEH